jgi:hypothetical protein
MIMTLELTRAASKKDGLAYGASKGFDATQKHPTDATCSERFRDNLFGFLDGPCMFKVNIANILIIIVNGAFFFFLMVGWQDMCSPRKGQGAACQPRNWWLNWSIQLLNVNFTFGALVAFPWRIANSWHLWGVACPGRANDDGFDLYGHETEEIWFHIPRSHRRWINAIFMSNAISQFINQATRIVYHTFKTSNEMPGVVLTNLWFIGAFVFAGWGAVYLGSRRRPSERSTPGAGPTPWGTPSKWCGRSSRARALARSPWSPRRTPRRGSRRRATTSR